MTERLRIETRQVGGRLVGEVQYNTPASDRPEMFDVGAFDSVADPLNLTLQHDREREPVASTADGTLEVRDTSTSLQLAARLRPGSAEHQLVTRGSLAGLSVEFAAREERQSNGMRIITRAHLHGIGLVDQGSYPSTVELRARGMGRSWFRARIPTGKGKRMQCECAGPGYEVEFDLDAFAELDHDILAVGGGGFGNVLGSTRRETLLLDPTKKGLEIGLTNAETETAKKVISAGRVADIYARPILDLDASEFTEAGGVRFFTRAYVRAILVKPTTSDRGHIPAKIIDPATGAELRQRRRVWL